MTTERGKLRIRPLPAPRLQLRWVASVRNPEYAWECHYELVLPLRDGDCRRTVYDEAGEPTGEEVAELIVALKLPTLRDAGDATPCVSVVTGSLYYDPPHRDGVHARWDSAALGGLPIYVIAPSGEAFERQRRAEPEIREAQR